MVFKGLLKRLLCLFGKHRWKYKILLDVQGGPKELYAVCWYRNKIRKVSE